MKLIEVKTKHDKKRYIKFIYELYKNDNNFSDMNLILVKNFLYKKDNYAKRANVIPIIVEEEQIKLVCIFISTNDSEELKLSFLEFRPNSRKYIEEVINYGKKLMRKLHLRKMIIGINGQVSYGLGILVPGFNNKFEFNSNYNFDYYVKELDEIIKVKKRAFSYNYDAEHSLSFFDKAMLDEINKNYTFRYMNKKRFKEEMIKFGDLCDKTLSNTPYYSYKTPYEMYQLMKQMKFLMKNEDIIFAMKDGKEVGFVYTHPDYAEFFDRPKINYLKLFFRMLKGKPKNLIYNVIGVLPEHQKIGLAVGLINYSIKMRRSEYSKGVSSFILEDNTESNNLCKKMAVGINKEYRLYEIEE